MLIDTHIKINVFLPLLKKKKGTNWATGYWFPNPNPHSKGIWLCEVWNLDQCGRAWLTNSFYKKVGFWGRERGFPRRACQYFAILWWGWGVYKYFWRVIKTAKTWWRQRVVMELPYLIYYYGLKLITKSFKISKIFSWIILNYFNNLFFFN